MSTPEGPNSQTWPDLQISTLLCSPVEAERLAQDYMMITGFMLCLVISTAGIKEEMVSELGSLWLSSEHSSLAGYIHCLVLSQIV